MMLRIFNNYKMYKHDIGQKHRFSQILRNQMCNFYIFTRLKSHYTSLELSDNASHEEIKSAYYKLSLKYHPDRNQGNEGKTAKFREISEAYEILSNPEKKKIYDHELQSYPRQDSFRYDSPNTARRSSKYQAHNPNTGRTSQYNYDEHFKMHYRMQYDEYVKQRQRESEQYRKWYEAQRNSYNSKYSSNAEKTFHSRVNHFRAICALGFLMWFFLLCTPIMFDMDKPNRKSKVYYDGSKEKSKIYYDGNKEKPKDS